MSGHHLLFLKKLRHIVIIYRTVGVCVRACVPGGGYMALELFFVSARTNKRHHRHHRKNLDRFCMKLDVTRNKSYLDV